MCVCVYVRILKQTKSCQADQKGYLRGKKKKKRGDSRPAKDAMLKRHGTRLDIGTAEDVAELNAAEALLRASYKPSPIIPHSGSSVSNATGSASVYGVSGNISLGSGGVAAPYNLPGAMTRSATATSAAAFTGAEGLAQPSSNSTSATTPTTTLPAGAASPPPPHVHLGRSAGRVSPTSVTSGAGRAPTSASAGSIHAQRTLYRGSDAIMSPSSQSSAVTTVSGYPASSGRTPGGGGVRATAPLLYYPPRGDDGDSNGDGPAEADEEEDRGRPSMRRAPFAVPVPVASATGSSSRPARLPTATQPPYARRGGPSADPLLPPAPPGYTATVATGEAVEGGEGEERGGGDDVPGRPSRVSGRYRLPRSPGHGDPSFS